MSDESLPLRYRFAAQMLRLRLAKGWSQEDLAEHSGLHRNHISKIERCTLNPGLDSVERIATALEVSVSVMLEPPDA